MNIRVEGGEIVSARLIGNKYIPIPPKPVFMVGLLLIMGMATKVLDLVFIVVSASCEDTDLDINSNNSVIIKYLLNFKIFLTDFTNEDCTF